MLSLINIIQRASNKDLTTINPTIIYNEGWMTRLLVEVSQIEKLIFNDIDFNSLYKWYSEGLLKSPFQARRRTDKYREGFTHTDIAIGDFSLNPMDRGEIKLIEDPRFFGVIEAKMGSNLSPGTTYVPNYNQASRNVACIALLTQHTDVKILFTVVAPKLTIEKHNIYSVMKIDFILDQIKDRFDLLDSDDERMLNKNSIIQKASECKLSVIDYESWLAELEDSLYYNELKLFYENCKKYNKIS